MGGVPVDPVTKQRLNISELNLENHKTISSMKKNFLFIIILLLIIIWWKINQNY